MVKKGKHDEKIILGLGIAIAIVLIALSVKGFKSLETKFNITRGITKELSETGEEQINRAATLLNNAPEWRNSKLKGRDVELLTPIQLFQIPGHYDLIDLFNENGTPVHPPIPNKWWLKYKIDPSFKDALARDADTDGFSNLEEFKAQTNPSNSEDFPDLISKLKVVGSSSLKWKVYFSSDIGENQYQFKYADGNKAQLRSQYIGRGARFFDKDPALSRFVLNDVLERELDANGVLQKVKYAVIEDTKKQKLMEIVRGRSNDVLGQDYNITFILDALGKEGETFTLGENTKFDLPNGKVSEEGKFHFTEVREGKNVIIQYLVGEQTQELSLPIRQ